MAKVAKRTTASKRAVAEAAVGGPDELEFLGSRERSNRFSESVARTKAAAVAERALSLDRHVGSESHEQGTALVELYMRHADEVLGFRSFRAFLLETWPLDLGIAYERMQIARLATRREAESYGYTACVLGLRIMRALRIESFEQFKSTTLRLHEDDGGGTVTFPAPATALRSVLRALHSTDPDEAAPDVGETLRRYRAAVDALIAVHGDIAALKPVVWADAEGAYVRVTAGTADQAKAAVKLYQRIARVAE